MAATWLKDLTEYLEDQGVAVNGTNMFQDFMPPTPDACVVCYDAGGNYIPQGTAIPWQEVQAEIRVRGANSNAAQTLADSVISKINHKNDITMNSNTVVRFMRPNSTPSLLEKDTQRRCIMLIRLVMQIQRTMVY